MDYCDCHAEECRLCGRQLPHTADQLFLIGLIEKADSGIPCGWMTDEEQRHLDSIRAAIVDCHAPQVPWTGLPVTFPPCPTCGAACDQLDYCQRCDAPPVAGDWESAALTYGQWVCFTGAAMAAAFVLWAVLAL